MQSRASAELAGISRRLATVDKSLKLATGRAIRETVKKSVIPALQASARANLPKSGGLNEHVASQKITVNTGLTPRTSYVRLRQPFYDAKQTDKGYVRHPVFDHVDPTTGKQMWRATQAPQAAGWWTNVLKAAGPEVTAALMVVMREMNGAITRANWSAVL